MTLLSEAIQLATMVHDGQVDKAGKPYIFHPLRVMMAAEQLGDSAMIVAVLHDTIEDTDLKLSELVGHYPDEVIEALDAISKRKGETLAAYYERVKKSRLAYLVKHLDITDNYDRIWRIEDTGTRERLYRKYTKAREVLA